MGIANKCFEILENRSSDDVRNESHLGLLPGGLGHAAETGSDDGEDDDVDDDVDDVDDEDEDEYEADDTESDEDEDGDVEDEESEDEGGRTRGGAVGAARLRLREILFYDDKVAVFKARHGRL